MTTETARQTTCQRVAWCEYPEHHRDGCTPPSWETLEAARLALQAQLDIKVAARIAARGEQANLF